MSNQTSWTNPAYVITAFLAAVRGSVRVRTPPGESDIGLAVWLSGNALTSINVAILEIFSVKEWPDLEILV